METGVAFFIIILSFLLIIVEPLRFDLESGVTRCISDDIRLNSMTVGEYFAVNPNKGQPLPEYHKLYFALFSGKGTRYHHVEDVESGEFAIEIVAEDGKHMACFATIIHKPAVNTSVEFNWRSGVVAKDWPMLAKKGSVDAMKIELQNMEHMVNSIHLEMYSIRESEEGMVVQNMKTNSMMGLLSLVSLFLCLCVVGLQFWHLKSFFEKKKII